MMTSKKLLEEIKEDSELRNISGGGSWTNGAATVWEAIASSIWGSCSWSVPVYGENKPPKCPNGGMGCTCH